MPHVPSPPPSLPQPITGYQQPIAHALPITRGLPIARGLPITRGLAIAPCLPVPCSITQPQVTVHGIRCTMCMNSLQLPAACPAGDAGNCVDLVVTQSVSWSTQGISISNSKPVTQSEPVANSEPVTNSQSIPNRQPFTDRIKWVKTLFIAVNGSMLEVLLSRQNIGVSLASSLYRLTYGQTLPSHQPLHNRQPLLRSSWKWCKCDFGWLNLLNRLDAHGSHCPSLVEW